MNASHPPSGEAQHIDSTVLDAIRRQMPDNPAIITRIIDSFLKYSPGLLGDLRSALLANDPEAVRKAAHAMKSSNAQVGAKQLAVICQQLELLGSMGQLPDADVLLAELEEEYRLVENEMSLLLIQAQATKGR